MCKNLENSVIVMQKLRCTLKRVSFLRFILTKGNSVRYDDLSELVGRVVNSRAGLYELVRRTLQLGLIALNEYGELYVTRRGIEYLEMCKERGL